MLEFVLLVAVCILLRCKDFYDIIGIKMPSSDTIWSIIAIISVIVLIDIVRQKAWEDTFIKDRKHDKHE